MLGSRKTFLTVEGFFLSLLSGVIALYNFARFGKACYFNSQKSALLRLWFTTLFLLFPHIYIKYTFYIAKIQKLSKKKRTQVFSFFPFESMTMTLHLVDLSPASHRKLSFCFLCEAVYIYVLLLLLFFVLVSFSHRTRPSCL